MALPVSPALKRQGKLALVALSLGHLMFVRRWYDLEHLQSRALDYYRDAPPGIALLAATTLASLLLALLFRLAWLWVELYPTRRRVLLGHCAFLLVLMLPFEIMRRYWNLANGQYDWFTNISILTVDTLLVIGILRRLRGSLQFVQVARAAVISVTLLMPALIADFGTNYSGEESASAFQPKLPLPMLPVRPGQPRVLWLLFDEFDTRLAFDHRPASLALPELDRLRAESLVATAAEPTDNFTIMAAPSLLTGRLLARTELIDATTLALTDQGSRQISNWGATPTVFQRARALGVNAELVGWYHPYCRVLGDEVVRCLALSTGDATPPLALQTYASRQGVARSLALLFQLGRENVRGVFSGNSLAGWLRGQDRIIQRDQQAQYFQIRDRALAAGRDPQIGMAYLHFPTPHMFPIYNRRARNFPLDAPLDYLDNLALVDRTVGEIRRALEEAGLWDQTTILISSDHGLRPELWRKRLGWTSEMERLTEGHPPATVPFILKLAGQSQGQVVATPFSAVVTGDLLLAVLRQQLRTAQDASEWIEAHAASPHSTGHTGMLAGN